MSDLVPPPNAPRHPSSDDFFTQDQREALLANGLKTSAGADINPHPVVKLFTPDANATWLLTEIDPHEPDRAFGLCDLGHGSPELGYLSLTELRALRGPLGLPVEVDQGFISDRPLSNYAAVSRHNGRIDV
jgi:hypothetical protein